MELTDDKAERALKILCELWADQHGMELTKCLVRKKDEKKNMQSA